MTCTWGKLEGRKGVAKDGTTLRCFVIKMEHWLRAGKDLEVRLFLVFDSGEQRDVGDEHLSGTCLSMGLIYSVLLVERGKSWTSRK